MMLSIKLDFKHTLNLFVELYCTFPVDGTLTNPHQSSMQKQNVLLMVLFNQFISNLMHNNFKAWLTGRKWLINLSIAVQKMHKSQ